MFDDVVTPLSPVVRDGIFERVKGFYLAPGLAGKQAGVHRVLHDTRRLVLGERRFQSRFFLLDRITVSPVLAMSRTTRNNVRDRLSNAGFPAAWSAAFSSSDQL
jgi:hypothetical protein